MLSVLFAAAFSLINSTGVANAATAPQLVPIEIQSAYLPAGFDSNDKVQVVVDGWFPNSCYKVGPYKLTVDPSNHRVMVQQFAYKYSGICLEVMTPFYQVIDVGLLNSSVYNVTDGTSGRVLG